MTIPDPTIPEQFYSEQPNEKDVEAAEWYRKGWMTGVESGKVLGRTAAVQAIQEYAQQHNDFTLHTFEFFARLAGGDQ